MTKVFYILLLTLATTYSQAQDVPASAVKQFSHIIDLIRHDDASALSRLIIYPLKRPNPLPPIRSPRQFVTYYSTLFDQAFKNKLQRFKPGEIFEHEDAFAIFDDEIWIDPAGKILAINYSSAKENILRINKRATIQSTMYPSVRHWDRNVIVGRSANLLVRIDQVGNDLRYASWSKGKTVSEKPNIILYRGTEEARGTEGGWIWTFKNGDWTYVVDESDMCDDPKNCGLFLRLEFKGSQKSSIKLNQEN